MSPNVARAIKLTHQLYLEEARFEDVVLVDLYPMEIPEFDEVVIDVLMFDCINYERFTHSFRYDTLSDTLTHEATE